MKAYLEILIRFLITACTEASTRGFGKGRNDGIHEWFRKQRKGQRTVSDQCTRAEGSDLVNSSRENVAVNKFSHLFEGLLYKVTVSSSNYNE